MEPIINPWVIYVLGVVDSLRSLFYFAIITMIIVAGFTFFIMLADEFKTIQEHRKKAVKYAIRYIIVLLTFVMLVILIPTRNTVIGMIVANSITYNNIDSAVKTGKKIKDEVKKDVLDIIQAITKEEKEKK